MDTPDKTLQTNIWIPSWKGVTITVLIGANLIFFRIITELGFKVQSLNDNCTRMAEKMEQLCVASNKTSEGCVLCPNDWQLYGDNCYYYSDDTWRTWDQSQEQCEMMGGHLVVIEDPGQQGFIHRIVTQQEIEKFWIGLHQEGDGWRWVNGRHYNTSLFQVKVISGSCVLVTRGGYYTADCNSIYTLLCQKKAVNI